MLPYEEKLNTYVGRLQITKQVGLHVITSYPQEMYACPESYLFSCGIYILNLVTFTICTLKETFIMKIYLKFSMNEKI